MPRNTRSSGSKSRAKTADERRTQSPQTGRQKTDKDPQQEMRSRDEVRRFSRQARAGEVESSEGEDLDELELEEEEAFESEDEEENEDEENEDEENEDEEEE